MKIGFVDLDTSHAQAWTPLLREMGHDVTGVWDGGSIHPPGYARTFAAEHEIATVFPSVDAMADAVDCAVLLGSDWDKHIAKARPFIDAGKAVLMDKPLAGNLDDLHQLRAWAKQGARIFGGSSLRFCAETQEWLALPVAERGTPQTVLCGCGNDEFNYGIHAYAMLSGIMGGGVHSVQHLDSNPYPEGQRRIRVNWPDGRMGIVVVGTAPWMGFYTSITTEKSILQFKADASKLYSTFLTAIFPYLSGATDQPPLTIEELIEPELCALAALQSWTQGNREVRLSEIHGDTRYDGKGYAEETRQKLYPGA